MGSIMPENKDSDFSWKDFQQRVNGELADILGNFVFRTTSFTVRYFDGIVPQIGTLSDPSKEALASILEQKEKVADAYNRFSFKEAITETMQLARIGNKYFTDREPWKTRKTDIDACAETMYVSLQLCSALSVMFAPIMPVRMGHLQDQLGISMTKWTDIGMEMLPSGADVKEGSILFVKIEDSAIQARIDALTEREASLAENVSTAETTESEKPYAPQRDEIVYDDFAKLDLRIGVVLEAESVKGSKKLLKLSVDIGYETRTILSGIAQHYTPEEMLGKKVVVVANLKPRPMMGTESHGMILMSEDRNGRLVLTTSDNEPGSPVT
jgi:methionyl-tRNA synthetase